MPHQPIIKSADLPWLPKRKPGVDEDLGEYKALWEAHGCEQFEVRLTRIAAGGASTLYHTHTKEEEWFYVLSGRCHIQYEGDWRELEPGDSVFKRCGTFHTFRNFGEDPCELIMLGTNVAGSRTIVGRPPGLPPSL